MSIITTIIDVILHLDKYLIALLPQYGVYTYIIFFLIIFFETGLVIAPFLPGDSMIFATGAIAALGAMNIYILFIVFATAAILGDTLNYWIGSFIGSKILNYRSKFINKYETMATKKGLARYGKIKRFLFHLNPIILLKYSIIYWLYRYIINQQNIDKTKHFFEKYGAKTIILARFVPIVRTFAPFLAGIGKMSYWKFVTYNVVGGIVWVGLFLFAGYFVGNQQIVKDNFSLAVLIIIVVSTLPILYEFMKHKLRKKRSLKRNND